VNEINDSFNFSGAKKVFLEGQSWNSILGSHWRVRTDVRSDPKSEHRTTLLRCPL